MREEVLNDAYFSFRGYLRIILCLFLPGNSFFTFTLNAYYYSNFTGMVPNEIALNKTLYFKAEVVTQSADHNLDLFPVHCWSSESENPAVYHANDFTLIKDGYVRICTANFKSYFLINIYQF